MVWYSKMKSISTAVYWDVGDQDEETDHDQSLNNCYDDDDDDDDHSYRFCHLFHIFCF